MSKKIKDENGKTYIEKKPFYKKWWFWLLAIIIVAVIAGTSSNGDEPKAVNEGNKTEETQKDQTAGENKVFKVGQVIRYNHTDMRVNKVEFLNQSDLSEPIANNEQFVAVQVAFKNNGEEKVDYNPLDFKLSADGNETDFTSMCGKSNIDNDTMQAGTLNKGAYIQKWLVGKANKNTKQLQLLYTGNAFDEEAKITVNLK